MADAYSDLDALAAKGAGGRLWLCAPAKVWSYGGAPTSTSGSNLQVPAESVPDSRVQAALTDGSWVVSVLDTLATPIKILAVQKAPATGSAPRPLTVADLGTPAAA